MDNFTAICTIAGINIAMFGALATLVIWTVTKHGNEIDALGHRLDGHATRIDQLYEMFVDLIKSNKNI